MAGSPRPKFSSHPSEPAIRRLGLRSSTHIERPIRLQVGLAFAVALMLLAIPLYLLRRPEEPKSAPAAKPPAFGFSPSVPVAQKPGEGDERLSLGEPVRVRCSSSPSVRGQEGRLCDGLLPIEEGLKKAIVETIDCAPSTGAAGTLNYVLKADFAQKTLHVFPGASGDWKGPSARRAAKCVKQALSMPDWDRIEHRYRYYEIALLVTYRPPPPTAAPLFE
jgi:hypothetical protein